MEVQNLRAYLANIGMTMRDFAQVIECSPMYLSHVMAGRRKIGKRLARDIRQATDGIIDLSAVPQKKAAAKDSQQQQQQPASV